MWSGKMNISGIRTHNLKNLDFSTQGSEIIGICGVSGGGKSSFAYSTIYKLCAETYNSIEDGYSEDADYIVDDFSNILPAVAIKQSNFNANNRSSIYSYLKLSSVISTLFHEIPYKLLKLNNPANECEQCKGEGITQEIDYNRVIDFDCPVSDMPFIPWKNKIYGNNKYENLFAEYCKYLQIDMSLPLKKQPRGVQDILINQRDDKIFTFKYKHNKKVRNGKMCYIGIKPYLDSMLKSDKKSIYSAGLKFSLTKLCSDCGGAKINKDKYKHINLYSINFIDFLNLSIDDLVMQMKYVSTNNKLYKILKAISSLGIGYLSLNRSIPSLSGGELQKLRFAHLTNISISKILVVVDEISSGVHWSDFDNIINPLLELKNQNNTVLLIEHNPYFLSKCDRLICIGPLGGTNGGYITNYVLEKTHKRHLPLKIEVDSFMEINNITINNIHNETIKFPNGRITSIVGKSGSGKTSLARFIEENTKNTLYISQKSLRGNIKSNVATYTKINKVIASLFEEKYSLDYKNFMPNEDSSLVCKKCNGNGMIKYERGFESSIIVTCPQCNGMLFDDIANKYNIHNCTIKDLYNMEINALSNVLKNTKINNFINYSVKLSLGHLQLNRKLQTLSGGEAKRIRLLDCLLNSNTNNKCLIIDELGAGLDSKTCVDIMSFLNTIKSKTIAILIIDHNPNVFLNTDYVIEMGPESGPKGGKVIFSGFIQEYIKKNRFDPLHLLI